MNGYDQCSDEELIRRLHAGEEGDFGLSDGKI